jgi:hypothetical protein
VTSHVSPEVGTAGPQLPFRPIETTATRPDLFKIDGWTQWAGMFHDRPLKELIDNRFGDPLTRPCEDFSAGL